MDLSKYTGSVALGTYNGVKITDVAVGKSKAGDPLLVFTGHFSTIDVDQQWRYSLNAKALWRLTKDLTAAEALRDGDSYSDDNEAFAQEIKSDLNGKFVVVEVTQQPNSQFSNYAITGVDLGM